MEMLESFSVIAWQVQKLDFLGNFPDEKTFTMDVIDDFFGKESNVLLFLENCYLVFLRGTVRKGSGGQKHFHSEKRMEPSS